MKKFIAFFFYTISFNFRSYSIFIIIKKTMYSFNLSKYSTFSILLVTYLLVVSMFIIRFLINSLILSSISFKVVYPFSFRY
jgi:hypothetical protein